MNENEIRAHVHQMAAHLTRIHAELAALTRRKEFESELRERGNWVLNKESEPPWVARWNKHFAELATNPIYLRLHAERTEAHAELHSPEFAAALDAMTIGDASGAEYAIAYLEADPFYFRSGYLKSTIARRLRRIELPEAQAERVRKAILDVVLRGGGYEVVEMRALARRIENTEFREKLRSLAAAPESGVSRRASRMLRFCEMNDTPGRDLRGVR